MSFIKKQKIKRDENGNIKSGSASLVESVYATDRKSGHSKQVVVEPLGKVLYLYDDGKRGIFDSPSRGIVEYDAETNVFTKLRPDDKRLPAPMSVKANADVHTVFGDSWFTLNVMNQIGLSDVIYRTFETDEDRQRVLSHVIHTVAKNGSKINCEDWIAKSVVANLIDAVSLRSLKSDTKYFAMMGSDSVKIRFFREFVSAMRSIDPNFGKTCYIDSTPLPNDIENSPYNALSRHGTSDSENMMRLVLVLDEATGLPVWFDIIPGNLLDVSTSRTFPDNVEASIGVHIKKIVLDAGYACKALIEERHIEYDDQGNSLPPTKAFIAKMPARNGFKSQDLYEQVKDKIHDASYFFVRDDHTYFGTRIKVNLWGYDEYAYVYVDHNNAVRSLSAFMKDHHEDFAKLSDDDKNWKSVSYGFFTILSNEVDSPRRMLDRYFCRTHIENVFKTSKEYLDLLPLRKWSDQTVKGKILSDTISTILLLRIREKSPRRISTTGLFGKLSSLMSFKKGNNIIVETPNRQVKDLLALFALQAPAFVSLGDLRKLIEPTNNTASTAISAAGTRKPAAGDVAKVASTASKRTANTATSAVNTDKSAANAANPATGTGKRAARAAASAASTGKRTASTATSAVDTTDKSAANAAPPATGTGKRAARVAASAASTGKRAARAAASAASTGRRKASTASTDKRAAGLLPVS